MLSYLRANGWRALMTRELPTMVFALVVAELWFKFGSFTLEVLGFLAVWIASSALVDGVVALVRGDRAAAKPRTDENNI
jgi:hypothetical protein